MTPTPEPFEVLLARARQGDEDALTAIVRQYEPEVRLVARLRLGPALRPYLDSLDLVQSVHKSLLLGLRQNKYELSKPEHVVALALTMVRRKAARAWQRLQRQKRDSGVGGGRLSDLIVNLTSPQADPAEAVAYRDAVEHLCSGLDATERQLMELNLQGYRTAEVARELGLNADVLRVKLSRLRARLRAAGVAADWV